MPKVLTEDLGKIFEMAICMVYKTPYVGKYKYGLEAPTALLPRLATLPDLFPACKHTAKRGARYDFTAADDETCHLSAKTTKGGGKVAPQVVGQASRRRFCEVFALPLTTTVADIKTHIQTNTPALLTRYAEYTFDCPTIYYNRKTDRLSFVRLLEPINWSGGGGGEGDVSFEFSHVKAGKEWKESTTLYIKKGEAAASISIGEWQVHNHRDCIKFRWCYEHVLDTFPEHFAVTPLE